MHNAVLYLICPNPVDVPFVSFFDNITDILYIYNGVNYIEQYQ